MSAARVSLLVWLTANSLFALDPAKAISQYSRALWTHQQGLPQDRVRAIAQTQDGFLWLGTDEGLVRFNGYEFTIYNKERDRLSSNSIGSLAAGTDGSLWIGTPEGLIQRKDNQFRAFTTKDGLPADAVEKLFVDSRGTLWVVAGGILSKLEGQHFVNFMPGRELAMTKARAVTEDRDHNIYVLGWSSVARLENDHFRTVVEETILQASFPIAISVDGTGTVWILGTRGVTAVSQNMSVRRFGPNETARQAFGLNGSLQHDGDGNVWVGYQGGLGRLRKFSDSGLEESDEWGAVECVFEDRDGNVWLGTHSGLVRLHDDLFTIYGKGEGFPSEPQAIQQDSESRIWIGYRDQGLFLFPSRTQQPGYPRGGIFTIREGAKGELLVAGRDGLSILKGNTWHTYIPPDPLGRKSVYDSILDVKGRIWLMLPAGLARFDAETIAFVPQDSSVTSGNKFMVLAPGKDGSVWAGSTVQGLLHYTDHGHRLYTMADGLGSQQIASLHTAPDGVLWIGTIGGGLNRFVDGRFETFTEKDGLPSDNVLNIIEDGSSFWLSTTWGVSQISKQELDDFSKKKISRLHPVNYGAAGGLRSTVGYPRTNSGKHADGTLWFLTNKGVAVYKPTAGSSVRPSLPIYLAEMEASGKQLDFDQAVEVPPGEGRLHIRFGALYLSAPDLVDYSYKLDGLDSRWVHAGRRRGVNYDNLRPGHYLFTVRAELPGIAANERGYEFDVLPHYYQTLWFRSLLVLFAITLAWLGYQYRVRQLKARFAAVLEERSRLAREIHDTLTQAFVGISSQLDVMDMRLPADAVPARRSLDLARRMTDHSLTEARRAVMDLRTSALDEQDIATALRTWAKVWAEDENADIVIDVEGKQDVPQEVGHQVLRIAQEGIANAVKHSGASRVSLWFRIEGQTLHMRVSDDGCGFEPRDVFTSANGHFGLIGMRERADRVGGELKVESRTGQGTRLDLTVPL